LTEGEIMGAEHVIIGVSCLFLLIALSMRDSILSITKNRRQKNKCKTLKPLKKMITADNNPI
jgi:hypothetical protein